MGTTYHNYTIERLLMGHSDFVRQDIISFVRVHIKKWRNHCPRCYHSVDRRRRFPLSNECLSITFYSKFLIIIKVLKLVKEKIVYRTHTPQNSVLIKQGELLYSAIIVLFPNLCRCDHARVDIARHVWNLQCVVLRLDESGTRHDTNFEKTCIGHRRLETRI